MSQQNRELDLLWQSEVIKRDEKCVMCGSPSGLSAHHIIYRRYANTRLCIDNGATLCIRCHGWIHKEPNIVRRYFPNYDVLRDIANGEHKAGMDEVWTIKK